MGSKVKKLYELQPLCEKVLDIGKCLQENKYTGQFTVTFQFSDGGIRDCTKHLQDRMTVLTSCSAFSVLTSPDND